MNDSLIDTTTERAVATYLANGFYDSRLMAEHFASPDCRAIFEAVSELRQRGEPVDALATHRHLEQGGVMTREVFWTILSDESIVRDSKLFFDFDLKALDECRCEREKYHIFQKNLPLAETQAAIASIRPAFESVKEHLRPLSELSGEWLADLERRFSSESGPVAISTGIPFLDQHIGGLEPAKLILVAARPNVGKTAMLLNFAIRAAEAGRNVAFFSLEMTAAQVVSRAVAQVAQIPANEFRNPRGLVVEKFQRITETMKRFSTLPLFIDDDPELSVSTLRHRIEQMKPAPELVGVDYLQIMRGEGRAENRQIEVGEISRRLKALTKEFNIPILVAAQLNRGPEGTGKPRRPRLSDLRESGSIEAEADVVLMLHEAESEEDRDEELREVDLIIRKNRDGAKDKTIKLDFLPALTTFVQPESNF